MAEGWIKLHRQIQECEFLWNSQDEPFDRRSAWIDLLLFVNHRDKRIMFNGKALTVKCGQRITSMRDLATRWHWSRDKVRRYLDLLEGEEMITRESDNRKTLITVVNYSKYQSECATDESTDKSTDEPQTSPQTSHRQVTNKNDKNDKNDKNSVGEKRKRFIPPTLEEVQAYVKERNSSVDPKRFFEYYETGGWKDAKGQSVKNWKQKLITWEKKDTSHKKKTQDFPEAETNLNELQKRIFAN